MPRDPKAAETRKSARARRDRALARQEIGQPTAPRRPASGPTSMAVKMRDAGDDALIENFLRKDRT